MSARWDAVLTRKPLAPDVAAECFGYLHEAERYDDAVEGILSAIRNNQGQHWMYEVLPLEMKLAQRPQKEIDRALLSRVDLAAGDVSQTLMTASLLSRMQAWDGAVALCQECVRHNPWQPIVWLKMKTIADHSGNPHYILGSRTGILKYVWNSESDSLHDEARLALEDILSKAVAEKDKQLAKTIQSAIREVVTYDLIIKAEWVGDGDVDLMLQEPSGHKCNHRIPISKNGGVLTRTSDGGEGRQTEEYRCQEASAGIYQVTVRLIRGRVISGRVLIRITRHAGTAEENARTVRIPVAEEDGKLQITLTRGRG